MLVSSSKLATLPMLRHIPRFSRSHVVVFARVVALSNLWCMGTLNSVEVASSLLTLVDLAGSERMFRCPAARLREPQRLTDNQTKKVRAMLIKCLRSEELSSKPAKMNS